jgi:Co/Zn/Cd efflux system component
MALVADSFHMLSDIAALLIAFLSGTPTPCPIPPPDPFFASKIGIRSFLNQ